MTRRASSVAALLMLSLAIIWCGCAPRHTVEVRTKNKGDEQRVHVRAPFTHIDVVVPKSHKHDDDRDDERDNDDD